MGITTVRFAKIENKLDVDIFSKLLKGIKTYGMRSKRPTRRGFIKIEDHKEGILFKFYKDIKDTTNILDDKNINITGNEILDGELKTVIIFNTGYIAYENPRIGRSSSEEIFYYLSKVWELYVDSKEKLKIIKIDKINYKSLKEFYKEAKRISSISLTDIGKTTPNPHWPKEWMKEIVEDLGKNTDNLNLSVGKSKNNLKSPKLIDEGLIVISKPTRIKGISKDNEIFDIRLTGILTFSYPEDNEEVKINKFIRLCKIVIKNFIK